MSKVLPEFVKGPSGTHSVIEYEAITVDSNDNLSLVSFPATSHDNAQQTVEGLSKTKTVVSVHVANF